MSKHTKEPSWTEDHFRKLFDMGKDGEERLEAVRQWSERNRVCTQALHGIDDPEAFMRAMGLISNQLRTHEGATGDFEYAYDTIITVVRKHLKGGDT